MAMLFCGSNDETALEIRKALGYDVAQLKDEDLKTSFQKLLEELEKNPDSYTLAVANSMVSQKNFQITEEYKSTLENTFKAYLQEADFASETKEALKKINDWVSQKTNKMIPKLLNSLNPGNVLVLLNAVYFKGFWSNMFDKSDTRPQDFHNGGNIKNKKRVDMMHNKVKFPFIQKETYKALMMPYKGDDIAMLVLLPESIDGLDKLELSLRPSMIQDLKQSMRSMKVDTAFPKFKLEYKKTLNEQFKALGMKRAFGPAQFGGITEGGGIFVSEIVHKAVIEVNEEGSEAAAATAVIMARCLTRNPSFVVDHPFIFCIFNTKSDMILFIGRVNDL